MRIFIACFFVTLTCISWKTAKEVRFNYDKQTICDCGKDFTQSYKTPRDLLGLLSDSTMMQTVFKKVKNKYCFNDIIEMLAKNSGICDHRHHNFAGTDYLSISLDKSLFKIDLLMWMRFYNCGDTTRLKQMTKSNFTKAEMEFMKLGFVSSCKLDTMILYEK